MSRYRRWRNVFRADQLNRELDSELEYHLAETVDRLVGQGLSEPEARREARRRLGNYGLQKERTRDMNIAAWLDATRADLAYGLRQLRANPAFSLIAILSLALGLGANTAMFQLVNALRLRMLPVENPQELVSIELEPGGIRSGWGSSRSAQFTYAEWHQIRTQQQAFAGVLAWSATRFNLTAGGEPRYAEGLYVSGDFFRNLGARPALGRTFTAEDDRLGCAPVAVLSYDFWQREFGGDPGVLGRTVNLTGLPVPIVGVTSPAFFGVEVGNRLDLAVPLCADRVLAEGGQSRLPGLSSYWLSIMGRLKPGATEQSASAHLRALSPGMMKVTVPPEYRPEYVKRYLNNKVRAIAAGTGISSLRREYERPLWLLMATAGLVLLIACANLANLLLARATVREPEIAVRLAIGASRWRLIRQLLAESLLLAVAGAALGVALAVILSRTLVAFISSADRPVFIDTALDWRVLGFTAALGIITCLLFGLLPALRATYLSPVLAMRSGGRSVTSGRDRFGVRRALVSGQVALSLVLLVGALLFARSLHNLMTNDAGFQPDQVLAVNIDFSRAPIPKARRLEIYHDFHHGLSSLPGVVSAAQVGATPVSGSSWDSLVGLDGARAAGTRNVGFFNRAAPGYFRTMGTRLLVGRDFNERDTRTAPKVAIVNEMFARKFLAGANPVGHTFHLEAGAGQPEPLFQIVGMVANTKYRDLKEEFRPIAFFPIEQDADPQPGATFVLRLSGPPSSVITGAKAAVAAISPSIGIDFRPFSAQLKDSLLREQLMANLSGGFGALAALLATLGLYGVIAYMIARRRNELGVRIALGATRTHIIRLVLSEALLLLGIGLTVGVLLSLWAGRAAATLLFGLEPHDAASLTAAIALLATVAIVASYLPARRAAVLDPVATLRNE